MQVLLEACRELLGDYDRFPKVCSGCARAYFDNIGI